MLASGEVTSVRLVEQYLARIEAYDRAGPRLNSIVRVNPAARETAAGSEFMTPQLRQAAVDQSLRIRVFGTRLPPEGVSAPILLDSR